MAISLCMIVKNEEKYLYECLKEIQEYVDEIIVIDTGSTDNTKAIARKFTGKVFDFTWVDDFSKARNFSISKASNDWVLVLDADEILVEFDRGKVLDFISKNPQSIGRIERIEIVSQKQNYQEEQKAVERIGRLFNRNFYHYEGRIHEQLTPSEDTAIKYGCVPITADHLGYIKDNVNSKNKWERNRKLLEKSILEKPEDPYLYYHLCKICYLTEEYEEAVSLYKKAMNLNVDISLDYVRDMIITYGYSLLNLEKYEEASSILAYEDYFRTSADYYFLLALIYMNMSSFKEAITYFEKCIGKNEKIIGTASYLPDYNIGVIYEMLGYGKEALIYYQKCGDYIPAKKRAEMLMSNFKNHKTSIIVLTYNNYDYNKICIESIRKYTKEGTYEIIVVDNHSTDGTVEWLKEQKDITVIYNNENLGFPKGCNQGIEIASGDEILLLNNDTIVTPRWLENLRGCLYSEPRIGSVGPVTNSCPNYQTVPFTYASVEEMIDFADKFNMHDPGKWEEKLRLIGFCMLIKKDVIDKVGMLDERFTPGNFEDDDLCLRMRKAGFRLMLCKDTFIHHFGGTSFKEDNKKFLELLKTNTEKFIRKWGIDPYQIADIEKEIADIIIKESPAEANILHMGCAGGATLLRIRNEMPAAKLYGIEKNRELPVNMENTAIIEMGSFNKIKKFNNIVFDFIIISNTSEKEIIHTFKICNYHMKESGTIYLTLSDVNKADYSKLIDELQKQIGDYVFEVIRKNGKQILCMKKMSGDKTKSLLRITLYNKRDLERFGEVHGASIETLIRRLENGIRFEENLEALRELILKIKMSGIELKNIIFRSAVDAVKVLNITGILYYQIEDGDMALTLLQEAYKLDEKDHDTIYNLSFVLHQAGENEIAMEILNRLKLTEEDEELTELKQQIEEAVR